MSDGTVNPETPVEGVRKAMAGFFSDFRGFQAEIEAKLKRTE